MGSFSRLHSKMEYNAIISHGQILMIVGVSNNYLIIVLMEKISDI